MGFYGNITNTSKTTFQFDRIYPNRLQMEAGANTDGIFLGRYVLVEYQEDAAYPIVYIKDNKFYSSPNYEETTRVKFLSGSRLDEEYVDGVYKDEYVLHYVNWQLVNGNITFDKIEYYKCIGSDTENYAEFKKVTLEIKSNYITNFEIDELHYSSGKGFKGYDSTVWTKASVEKDGQLVTKYVQIAELNSVVPTFDVVSDAPTMEPLTPHFDADSTNIYYKLHMQTPFGFRVKKGDETYSDELTTHYTTKYNESTNTTTTETNVVNADIFYNKNALEFKENDTSNRVIDPGENEIKIIPSGKSSEFNTKYSHYSKGDVGDILELSIHLPAVGYMVSQGWDVIHGPNRDNSVIDSLQGRLNLFRDEIKENEIPVLSEGKYLVGSTINGATNWIENGDNNEGEFTLDTLANQGFNLDDPWIETKIDTTLTDKDTYHVNGISIHHTFHDVDNSDSKVNLNDTSNSEIEHEGMHYDITDGTIDLYIPKVDSMGHVVGKHIETVTLPYSFKRIGVLNSEDRIAPVETNGEPIVAEQPLDSFVLQGTNRWIKLNAKDLQNDYIKIGHKLLVKDEEAAENSTLPNTNYGLNEDLDISALDIKNTFEVPVIKFDEAGHITKAETHIVELPENYNKIQFSSSMDVSDKTSSSLASIKPDSLADTLTMAEGNKWIYIDSVESNNGTDKITFSHYAKDFDFTNNINTNYDDSTITKETFEVIDSVTWDEAGHLTEARKSTHTLPKGFKFISPSNSTSATTTNHTNTDQISADTIKDDLKVAGGNRWIELMGNNSSDTLTISHAAPGALTNTAGDTTAVSPKFGSAFNTTVVKYDEAGHISGTGTRKVTLPIPSLTNGGTGTAKVLTGMTLNKEDGAFTYTDNYITNLKLTEYSNTSAGKTAITATDSIGIALGKLLNNIDMINGTGDGSIKKAIADIVDADGGTIDKLNEIVNWIGNNPENAANLSSNIAINANAIVKETEERIAADNVLNERLEALTKTVNDNKTVVENAVSSLDVNLSLAIADVETTAADNLSSAVFSLSSSINTVDLKFNGYSTTGNDPNYAPISLVERVISLEGKEYVLKSEYESKISELENLINNLQEQINALITPAE